MRWSLDRIAAACSGTASGEATIEAVSIDSRTVTAGSLFVAVRGERDDGHRYLDAAVAAGASAVLVERGRLEGRTGVEVEDTTTALLRLGETRRSEITCPVIAVTGSSGKTTTKDLIGAVLGGAAYRSPRSFNNEFGVPLTILGVPDGCDALVVEVGSRGRGHIRSLSGAIRPQVSVITNIGRAHLEMFGSVGAVADAKWELVEALEPGGIAVLPVDDAHLSGRQAARVMTFGEAPGADVCVREVILDDAGRASFTLVHADQTVRVTMPLPGRHQARNAAAAVAAAVAVGRPFAAAAERLADATVSPWRMESSSVKFGAGEVIVVNDAYNSNPDSLASALDTVAAIPGRHIAVLGKMHELGQFESDAHREAGARAASLGFTVLAVGEDPGIAAGAGAAAMTAADPAAALARLREVLRPGDVVLVKASRAAGLESIAAGIGGLSA